MARAAGQPVSLAAIGEVARAVAVPLQVAGGVDGPDQIELCFAAGATRVVVPLWAVVEDRARLAACLAVAGDWLAVGLDARPERLRDYPWKRFLPPTLDEVVGELAAAGVRRFVLSHGGTHPTSLRSRALAATGHGRVGGGRRHLRRDRSLALPRAASPASSWARRCSRAPST